MMEQLVLLCLAFHLSKFLAFHLSKLLRWKPRHISNERALQRHSDSGVNLGMHDFHVHVLAQKRVCAESINENRRIPYPL